MKSGSILSDLGATELRIRKTPGGQPVEAKDFSPPHLLEGGEDKKEEPEWLERELLKQNKRRYSVTHGEESKVRTQLQHCAFSAHIFEVHFEMIKII